MTPKNNLTAQPVAQTSLSKRMLQGAGIALVLIIVFLIQAGEPKPEWAKLWMVRPLVIVPLAGSMGGLFYFLMDNLHSRGTLNKAVAVTLSLIVYLFVLWLGVVLGLDGTWWN